MQICIRQLDPFLTLGAEEEDGSVYMLLEAKCVILVRLELTGIIYLLTLQVSECASPLRRRTR